MGDVICACPKGAHRIKLFYNMANSATKVQFLTTKRDGFYAETRLTDGKKGKKILIHLT